MILNKADLISATELQQVNDRIGQTLSPAVKVVEAENGKPKEKIIDSDALTGIE